MQDSGKQKCRRGNGKNMHRKFRRFMQTLKKMRHRSDALALINRTPYHFTLGVLNNADIIFQCILTSDKMF